MSYYIAKLVDGKFHKVVDAVKLTLKDEGLGVLTEFDIAKTLDEKLRETFRPYVNTELMTTAREVKDRLERVVAAVAVR